MSTLLYEKKIKVKEEDLDVMFFDDGSVIFMRVDEGKLFPIDTEHWEYDKECDEFFIKGVMYVTNNYNSSMLDSLTYKLNKTIKEEVLQYA